MSEHENMEVKTTETKPAKAETSKKTKAPEKKKGGRFSRYIREMKAELKKVAWPTKKQTINNTGVVLTCVIIAGAFVWVFDAVASQLISALMNLLG